jgi:hypothetical protein
MGEQEKARENMKKFKSKPTEQLAITDFDFRLDWNGLVRKRRLMDRQSGKKMGLNPKMTDTSIIKSIFSDFLQNISTCGSWYR